MAEAVTLALGVDDPFAEVLLLLGPLLLHAASGIATMTAATAILLDLFKTTVYSDSMKRRGRCTAQCHESHPAVRYLPLMKRDRYLFTTRFRGAEGNLTNRV